MEDVQNNIKKGFKDGLPIGLGYLSVSFTFGMMCVAQGVPIEIAVLISITCVTSAGQFSGLTMILETAPLMELALAQFIINLRYALMSLSLTQKIDRNISTLERAILSFGVTDEIFAVASLQEKKVGKFYLIGLMSFPLLCWTLGTLLGGLITSLMPASLQQALGIAIYGMFIAIIIPPAKKMKNIQKVILLAIVCSCILTALHVSSGTIIIISTLISAGLMAYFRPIKEANHD